MKKVNKALNGAEKAAKGGKGSKGKDKKDKKKPSYLARMEEEDKSEEEEPQVGGDMKMDSDDESS
jgi:hypothetical protein